jgi:pseudouridine kinase
VKKGPIICIGAALIDETYHSQVPIITGTSNPSNYSRSAGGVARNIASLLAQLGHTVELISHFGLDNDGEWLIKNCRENNIGVNHSIRNAFASGRFMALLQPNGELHSGAAVSCLEQCLTIDFLESKRTFLSKASLLLLDCNVNEESLHWLIAFAAANYIPCIAEPVSVEKSKRLINCPLDKLLMMSPNEAEIKAITACSNTNSAVHHLLQKGIQFVWMREGKMGSQLYSKEQHWQLNAPSIQVKDSTGAGDAALAGWIYAWIKGHSIPECQQYGHTLAGLILQVSGATIPDLSPHILEIAYEHYA